VDTPWERARKREWEWELCAAAAFDPNNTVHTHTHTHTTARGHDHNDNQRMQLSCELVAFPQGSTSAHSAHTDIIGDRITDHLSDRSISLLRYCVRFLLDYCVIRALFLYSLKKYSRGERNRNQSTAFETLFCNNNEFVIARGLNRRSSPNFKANITL